MKRLTVIGALPQFVKATPVSRALAATGHVQEIVVQTGQHFDHGMSEVFFEQLGLRPPDVHLDIHGGSHAEMTGRMLIEFKHVCDGSAPDRVMIYGDTNTTLAAGLAASKLHLLLVHAEADLRSFERRMLEKVNRVVTDHLSITLFCPTSVAVENLDREGISFLDRDVAVFGDVMQHAALQFCTVAQPPGALPDIIESDEMFILATIHRAENTDDRSRLASFVDGLTHVHRNVAPDVLPLHPKTRSEFERSGLTFDVIKIGPVGYAEMICLLERASIVVTDSDGLQKDAYFFSRPCLTVRNNTQWTELVEICVDQLVPADATAIAASAPDAVGRMVGASTELYGGGQATERLAAGPSRGLRSA